MVQLEQVGYPVETAQVVLDLVERGAEFDKRSGGERALSRQCQRAVVNVVQVGHEQQKIRRLFYGQEARAWHVDTDGSVERLDGRTGSGFELDDVEATIQMLRIHDDLHFELVLGHDPLHRIKLAPQIVGIEDAELADRLELVDIIFRDLSNLEQHQPSLVLDQRSSLDISTRLISDFHEELWRVRVLGRVDHVVEDGQVDGGAHVVNVGQEAVLLAVGQELVQESRVVEGLVEVTVTRWVPALVVLAFQRLGHRQKGLLVDTRVLRL